MADIAVTTFDYPVQSTATKQSVRTVESIQQDTGVAGEAITAGAPVRIDTATGRYVNAAAGVAGTADVYGVAVNTAPAGMALTVIRRGVMDGFNLTAQAFGALVYLSNTAGRIADAAGTVSVVLGRVIPIHSQKRGESPYKALSVER